MKEQSIALLNKAIEHELVLINQYMYFHFHCNEQGHDTLEALFKKIAIEEMRHVETIADRILCLKGKLRMEQAQRVESITDICKMLTFAAKEEKKSIRKYNDFSKKSIQNIDTITKQLFEDLLTDKKLYFNQFNTEINNLKNRKTDPNH